MLTQEYLKSVLHYDPKTGVFTYRVHRGTKAKGSIAGAKCPLGYTRIQIKRKLYLAHRLAWLYCYGVMPQGHLDHIDTTSSNNKITNLRLATKSQNRANSLLNKNSTTGYKGVYQKTDDSWSASIRKNGITRHLGTFASPQSAHEAYKKAALELHGEFANFG